VDAPDGYTSDPSAAVGGMTMGADAIERAAGAPYVALSTIDDIYPERRDRAGG